MPIVSQASGTQAATIGTEHILASIVTPGTYVLNVDLSALVIGDKVTLRAKTKTLTGGASGLAYEVPYRGPQSRVQKFSVPIMCLVELICTLQQTTGTGRSFPWNVGKLDGV